MAKSTSMIKAANRNLLIHLQCSFLLKIKQGTVIRKKITAECGDTLGYTTVHGYLRLLHCVLILKQFHNQVLVAVRLFGQKSIRTLRLSEKLR